MLLAHREDGRVDGGTLKVDRRKRLVTWTGAPNEIGCKRSFEAAFSDVKYVEEERTLPGLRLELREGKPKSWTLMPLPHFAALLQSPAVTDGGLQRRAEDANLQGPDGAPLRVGGEAGGAGPVVRKVPLEPEVERDIRRAVATLRDALASSGE